MSVDNTYSTGNTTGNIYSGSTGAQTTATDLSALTSAFQNAFRVSLSGGSGGTNDSLMKATEETSLPNSETRTERNRDERRQTETGRLDDKGETRRLQDRSEVRREEMDGEYQTVRDRRELRDSDGRNEFPDSRQERPSMPDVSGTVFRESTAPVPLSTVNVTPLESAMPMTPVIMATAQGSTSNIVSSSGEASLAPLFAAPVAEAAAVSVTVPIGQTTSTLSGMTSGMMSGTASSSLQAAASVLTIFTASGRLGDEKEKEENERRRETIGKKKEKTGTAFFGEALSTLSKPVPTARREDPIQAATALRRENRETKEKEPERPNEAAKTSDKDRNPEMVELLRQMQAVKEPMAAPKVDVSGREEQVLFVQRVAAACASAAQRNDVVRIKLSLDEKESLTLRIVSRKGAAGKRELSVRFETETPSTARLLRDNLDMLRDALAEREAILQDVEIEHLRAGDTVSDKYG